jgi:hypothetical protein
MKIQDLIGHIEQNPQYEFIQMKWFKRGEYDLAFLPRQVAVNYLRNIEHKYHNTMAFHIVASMDEDMLKVEALEETTNN